MLYKFFNNTIYVLLVELIFRKNNNLKHYIILTFRLDNNDCPNYFEVCCNNPIDATEGNLPYETDFKGCGFPSMHITPRITSTSEQTKFGELPWTTVVLMTDPSMTEKSIYKCGGSLFHPKVVLTAAHCVVDIDAEHLTVSVFC